MPEDLEFKKIYYEFYENLYHFFYNRVYEKNIVDDLCQDVFIKAWKNKIKSKDNIRSYLFSIARTRLIDYYRSNKISFLELDENKYVPEKVKEDNYREEVSNILDMLNKKDKIILILNRFDGFKQKEIAEMLDISVKTVEKRIRIAMTYLMKVKNNIKNQG